MNKLLYLSTIAAVALVGACAQIPPQEAPVQPLALKKLSIHRPSGDQSYMLEYDIAGYGHGQLVAAAGGKTASETCSDYTERMTATSSGAAVSRSVELRSACTGVRVYVEPLRSGTVRFNIEVNRLDAMHPTVVDGNTIMLPSVSNLNLSQEVSLSQGQTITMEPGGVSLTSK